MKLQVKSSHCFISKSMRIPTLTKISWWIIQLILLGNALSKASSERTEEDERGEMDFADQIEEYPTVNKCCPLNQRYEDGNCVETTQALEKNWRPPRSMIQNNFTEILDYPVYFRLNLALPNCSAGYMEKIIPNEPLRQMNMSSDGNESEIIEMIPHHDVLLSTEGYLLWIDENNLKHTYDYEKYCIDQVNKSALIAVLCKPTCTEDSPCVRKCCLPHEVLDAINKTCVPSQSPWKPYLYQLSDYGPVTESDETPSHIVAGVPSCKTMYAVDMRKESEKFYALLNGSLLTVEQNRKFVHAKDTFCIDGVGDEDSFVGTDYQPFSYEAFRHSGLETDQIALICHPEVEETRENKWMYYLFATVMYISAMFLSLTAIVYLILWEYQNIHGWLQFSYVMSLLLAYIFLASVQLFADYIHVASKGICEFSGSLIHFSFLSAFFWLTSMNFDLWWTFSGFRPMIASTRTGEKKRFAFFGLLSWGGAIIITGTGVTLDSMYKDVDIGFGDYLPRFGLTKCYFHNELSKLPFFYAPVAVLLCVNISFFLNTIYSLHKLQKDTRFATRQSSKQDKKRFVLFMKLFIVMGVCWIFEVISWLSILVYDKYEQSLKLAFLFTDTINALQGLFIFLIFTCKPNTCKQLEGQFKKLSARLEESRDKTMGSDVKSKIPRYIVIGFCAVVLPVVHGLRKLFNYCGRPVRSLDGRRNTCQTTVVSTFDKSRKASDSSACTTLSVIDVGSYELDTTYK